MYLDFVRQNFQPSEEELELLSSQETQSLYDLVQKKGGFIKTVTQQQHFFDFPENMDKLPIFQKYLLNYEMNTTKLDGSYLSRAHYVDDSLVLSYMITPPEQWLKEAITVWQFPEEITQKMNGKYFTFEGIAKRHGAQLVDIRSQDPNTDTFDPSLEQNSLVQKMKIEDYCKYLKNKNEFFSKHPEYPQDKVLFAVNIDLDNWDEETAQLYEYIPQSLLKHDGLVYLRQFYLGVNVPQVYLKTAGVWTGGHQENSSVSSINFNHGPDPCIWYTIDAEHVSKLLLIVPDLFKKEGLWFKNLNFFLENKIPIRRTVQHKGNLIILGAGCLHWVKSEGNTINSSWNMLVYEEKAFQQVIKRQRINDNFGIKCVIPIKNLLLDIYIHKKFNYLRAFLEDSLKEEIDYYCSQFHRFSDFKKRFDCRCVLICSKCQMEIFVFFQEYESEFRCIKCLEGEQIKIYNKYKPNELFAVIQSNEIPCSHAICSTYMGNTDCFFDKVQEPIEKPESISEEVQELPKKRYINRKPKIFVKDDEDLLYGSDVQLTYISKRTSRSNRRIEKVQDDLISEICTSQKSDKKNVQKNQQKIIKKVQKTQQKIQENISIDFSNQSSSESKKPMSKRNAKLYQL